MRSGVPFLMISFAVAGMLALLLDISGYASPGLPLAMLLLTGVICLHGAWRKHLIQAVEVEKHRLLVKLLDSSDVMILSTNAAGEITEINAPAKRGFGLREGGRIEGFFSDAPVAANGQQVLTFKRDGEERSCMVEFGDIHDQEDKIAGHFIIGIDMTERRARDEALLEKQQFIESVAQNSPTFFYTYDLNLNCILYANRSIPESLGFTEQDCAAMGSDPLPNMIHPEDLDVHFNRLQRCKRLPDGEICESEIRCLNSAGEVRWIYSRDVVFKRDRDGKPWQILVNVVDITDRKQLDDQLELHVLEIQDTNLALQIQTGALEEANFKLEALAYRDGLTEIANHRSFQEQLVREFNLAQERGQALSVILIDVDHFKLYNDTYGHPSGDIVLKKIAATLKACCPENCLPARYGGEEYAIICPNLSGEEVADLSESLRNAVERTPWPERTVTISIGYASFTQDMLTASRMVTQADAALYVSKAKGRNQVSSYAEARTYKLAS